MTIKVMKTSVTFLINSQKICELTSEEWVRQHVIVLLTIKAPKSWVNVEKQFTLAD